MSSIVLSSILLAIGGMPSSGRPQRMTERKYCALTSSRNAGMMTEPAVAPRPSLPWHCPHMSTNAPLPRVALPTFTSYLLPFAHGGGSLLQFSTIPLTRTSICASVSGLPVLLWKEGMSVPSRPFLMRSRTVSLLTMFISIGSCSAIEPLPAPSVP